MTEDMQAGINLDVFDQHAAKFPAGSLQDSSTVATSIGLYGLVRLIQPAYVVEVGTWEGATSIWLARAVAENGKGRYCGYEINPAKAEITRQTLEAAVPGGPWSVKQMDFMQEPYVETDFLFLDHAKEHYPHAFQKCLIPVGGYVVAHDTQAWPVAVQFYQYMKILPGYEILNIQQERGLMIARKLW